MNQPLQATQITEHVYWVGAIDWAARDFHGYRIGRGTSYNAYLVLADKVTLIDTVKDHFEREMVTRIASVIDPQRIDYVISNHAEFDHSGCLPQVIAELRPERVFASRRGVAALADHFHFGQEITPVKEGESLSLGDMTLAFVETPMLHWPESMFTYLAQERVLFSNDAFGMHLASSARFADEVDDAIVREEAARYFANILMPLSPLVTALLEKVRKLDLAVDVIATSHGPIWRKDLGQVLARYAAWAAHPPTTKAVVAYSTMWGSTDLMARAICDGLAAGGASAVLMPLAASHRSDVAAEVLDAGALVVGSPCLNGGILPTVGDLLTYLKGLKPRHLVGAAFGSYGWSGEAVGLIENVLREMKVELVGAGVKTKFVPRDKDLQECYDLGAAMADKLKGTAASV
jgi:flavorubredoxin